MNESVEKKVQVLTVRRFDPSSADDAGARVELRYPNGELVLQLQLDAEETVWKQYFRKTEERGRDFIWALHAMENAVSVRRRVWPNNFRLFRHSIPGEILIRREPRARYGLDRFSFEDDKPCAWAPSNDDLTARDWEGA